MRHSLPIAPQFYVTSPQTCPYLENRRERKLFTALQGVHANQVNNTLSKQGFRRSQNVLYRPSCAECAACMSARINVGKFRPSKTQRRCINKNRHLHREVTSPWATETQYELFRKYLEARHHDGGMADMDLFEYAAMIEETPVKTRVIEYWDKSGEKPELVAACLTDILDDGLSMVYNFYHPDRQKDSLGNYVILDHVKIAQEASLPYVYLGYWVPGSPKMGYKAKFNSVEIFHGADWIPLEDESKFSVSTHPLSVDPISEQVARISFPDTVPTDDK